MINKEQRSFKFSNGCVVSAISMGMNRFITINNRSYPMRNMTIAARQGIIDMIKKNAGFNNNVKLTYEEYYCAVTLPEKNTFFEVLAKPCGAKHTHIVVNCDNKIIFNGREQITFDSIRGIQNIALAKVVDYKSKVNMQTRTLVPQQTRPVMPQQTRPLVSQQSRTVMTSQPKTWHEKTKGSTNIPKKLPQGTSNPMAQNIKDKPNKTIEVITKFPEDNKKKNTLYRKFGISDEVAKRGRMSMTNYLIEGLYGKTPEGIKPPT